jgi:hypothetical protein
VTIILAEQKDIGRQLISVAKELVNIKTGENKTEKSDLYFGFAMGLLFALGKAEGFGRTDNMLGYITDVLAEIFADELPLESQASNTILQ